MALITTAINIRDDIAKLFNKEFIKTRGLVAMAASKPFLDKIDTFFTKSLAECLVEKDEFGLIYVAKNNFELTGEVGGTAVNKTTIAVDCIVIERSDLADQLIMIQESLVRTIIRHRELFPDYSIQIETEDELDLGQNKGQNRYMSTGITIELQRGI